MKRPVILCVGGDTRFIYTCRALCALGKVYSFGCGGSVGETVALSSIESLPEKADILVLPMLSGDGLEIELAQGGSISCEELAKFLNKCSLVTGGRLTTQVVECFSSLGHDVKDYFAREELVVRNCVPTAQGALQIAMQELAVTIQGTKTLIIGYGRVAKACAKVFAALGSNVTVTARRLSQLAQARNDDCAAFELSQLSQIAGEFDIVINTVPALVLTAEILERLPTDCVVIDLASKPGGTDFNAAKRLNVKAIHALALPGRAAPVTAGEIIAEAIRNIYCERRETDVFKGH